MAKETFDDFRKALSQVHGHYGSWCIVGGFDERGYALTVQKSEHEKEPMVRVGCRYLTLSKARSHYVSRNRNYGVERRRTAKQMLALINVAVAAAICKRWLPNSARFNAAPRKVRR